MHNVWRSDLRTTATEDHLFAVLAAPLGHRRRLVANALAERGIRIAAVGSLRELHMALDRLRPDVVIVDIALAANEVDILGLVRTARAPLIATSVGTLALRVELLLAGADDCLPAQFAPEELTARIISIVRRACRDAPPEFPALVQNSPVQIDGRAAGSGCAARRCS